MKSIKLIFASLIFIFSCNTNSTNSDAYGNFESDKTIISAEGNGKLLTLTIEEGDVLEKNKIIGQIDTLNLYFKKQQLLAQYSSLKSNSSYIDAQAAVINQQLNNILIDKNRIENLLKSEAATQKQFDDISGQKKVLEKQFESIKTQKSGLENQLKAISSQIDEINLAISKCLIINPLNGTVLSKLANENEMIAIGKPLYFIADLNNMKLKVYVTGNQLSKVILGKEVLVKIDDIDGKSREMNGKIIWISESAEFTPKTVQTKDVRANLVYAVKILVENDGGLKIGMPGEVVFK